MIKNNKIVLASALVSSMMLIGCSNKDVENTGESNKSGTQVNSTTNEVSASKDLSQVNLLKTGMKFNEASYFSEDETFYVGVNLISSNHSGQEISINLENLDIENETFKQEVKLAVNSVGGTDADFDNIMKKFNEFVKNSETAEDKKEFYEFEQIALNDTTSIELSLNIFEDRKAIGVILSSEDVTKYLESTNLKFNSTTYSNDDLYSNPEDLIEVEQSLHEDSFNISVGAHLSKKDDPTFKEYLDAAFKYFSVSEKHIEKINAKIASGENLADDEIIEGSNYYICTYVNDENNTFSIEITRD